ncbi:unnamed protein product [Cuscuta campestris]|uniref:Integrase catalytic domain-containing protein n=1 Tax=Cuscuta campestris TaxID=132261 RepID=A0A484N3T1_9ASTE|nr:unnamed protein product [Cuscuta campestris]
MADSGTPFDSFTLADIMGAIAELRIDLQTTKTRVVELAVANRPGTEPQRRCLAQFTLGWRPPPSHMTPPTLEPAPRMRVDAPRFSGEDPTGWIFKVQKYFDYFLTPEPERLQLVAMLIDHPASEWFHYFQANNPRATWPEFLDAVQQRFDSSYYENYIGVLSKLSQTSSVMDYQSAFETILNKVSGVPEATLIAMFNAGLKQPVRREVNLQNSSTLASAFALARELSTCHEEAAASYTASPTPRKPQITGHPGDKSPLPVVRLSLAEKTERNKKGLCWYCDEKWVPGHNCKHRFLVLMGPDDDDEISGDLPTSNLIEDTITGDVSSILSLAGSPRSLNMAGSINGVAVQVLLDGGSTHNFLHPAVAERLVLVIHPTPAFCVYVGNGDSLHCAYSCPQTPLSLQGHVFEVDLYVLSIHGPDVVLGVQWLQTLGKISHDYSEMTMEFTWQGRTITLRGDTPTPRPMSYSQFCALATSPEPCDYYEIVAASPTSAAQGALAEHIHDDVPRPIRDILADFAAVFGLPSPKDREFLFAGPMAIHTAVQAGSAPPHISVHDGILYYDHRLYISPESPLCLQLLHEFHATPTAGHQGVDRTFRRLAAIFFWPGMCRAVRQFVASCTICQATKYSTQKPGGLLRPLPIPDRVWEAVSLDFVTGLPPSKGFTAVLVVVDRLSKYVHFGPLPTGFDAPRVALLFVDIVVKHHGFPRSLVSDRDLVFMSNFWKELLRLSGTSLKYSTAYHPQTDGQTESLNRHLEQYLRTFVSERPSRWVVLLPWVELAINCTYNEVPGVSPFEVLYGRSPTSLFPTLSVRARVPAAEELLRERAALLEDLKLQLKKMQQRMGAQANHHRREVVFNVGDMVLLRLQPYRQHSLARPGSSKLARRFYGPFEILEWRDGGTVLPSLPLEFVKGRPLSTPIAAWDRRQVLVNGAPREEWLVQWSDGTLAEATWEPAQELITAFPDLRLGTRLWLSGGS